MESTGYYSGLSYTKGYYTDLSPTEIRFNLAAQGVHPPKMRYGCEIGFGMGLSLAIHAASSNIHWYGIEADANQAIFTQSLKEDAGIENLTVINSYLEDVDVSKLPRFQVIVLHGFISWVSKETRRVLIGFIEKTLDAGGAVYVSYNVKPGWVDFLPLRDLLKVEYDCNRSIRQNEPFRIAEALERIASKDLLESIHLKDNKKLLKKIESFKQMDPAYIAHEFLNEDWHLFNFNEISSELQRAQLTYACSASPLERQESLNLTTQQQDALGLVKHPEIQETYYDLYCGRQFRRDLFIKGIQREEPLEALIRQNFRVTYFKVLDERETSYQGLQRKVTLEKSLLNAVRSIFRDAHVVTLEELAYALKGSGYNSKIILQTLFILRHTGHLKILQPLDQTLHLVKSCTQLNRELLKKITEFPNGLFLASPDLGTAIKLDILDSIFLYCRTFKATSKDLMGDIEALLQVFNVVLRRDGAEQRKNDERTGAIKARLATFDTSVMPKLLRYRVI